MKYKYTAIVGAILILAGLFVWGSFGRAAQPQAEEPVRHMVAVSGNIVRGEPQRTKHGWRFKENGNVFELAFSSQSICAGKTSSGICNPTKFIDGRAADLEGELVDGLLRVYKLTFTEPVTTQ